MDCAHTCRWFRDLAMAFKSVVTDTVVVGAQAVVLAPYLRFYANVGWARRVRKLLPTTRSTVSLSHQPADSLSHQPADRMTK